MEPTETAVLCATAATPRTIGTLADRLDDEVGAVERAVEGLVNRDLLVRDGDELATGERLTYDAAGLERVVPAGYAVTFAATVTSTNALASEATLPAGCDRLVVAADRQTAGRGRHDRVWRSPPGGLWASVLDGRTRPASTAWIEQLAAALAVVDCCDLLDVETSLKWPNDVVTPAGAKLAGVLAEATLAGDRRTRSVCGIGVNANVDRADLPAGATGLRQQLGPVARAGVLAHLLVRFERRRRDPAGTLAGWRDRSHTVGRTVHLETPANTVRGRATAIDDAGALVVDTTVGSVSVGPDRCRRLRYPDESGA